jgi:hypothetical protein
VTAVVQTTTDFLVEDLQGNEAKLRLITIIKDDIPPVISYQLADGNWSTGPLVMEFVESSRRNYRRGAVRAWDAPFGQVLPIHIQDDTSQSTVNQRKCTQIVRLSAP